MRLSSTYGLRGDGAKQFLAIWLPFSLPLYIHVPSLQPSLYSQIIFPFITPPVPLYSLYLPPIHQLTLLLSLLCPSIFPLLCPFLYLFCIEYLKPFCRLTAQVYSHRDKTCPCAIFYVMCYVGWILNRGCILRFLVHCSYIIRDLVFWIVFDWLFLILHIIKFFHMLSIEDGLWH